MNTYIYLIRHGEVYNPHGTLYGRLPKFGLSENGKKEIEQTAAFLKDKHIDSIYSSPLLRARQTAEIIRKTLRLKKSTTRAGLIEVLTSYQGEKFADLSHDQSEIYLAPKSQTDETIEQIAARMQSVIKKLLKTNPGKHMVLVSHGDPLMILQGVIRGMPLSFDSVRTNKHYTYMQHGEVIEVIVSDKGEKTVTSVFQPLKKQL
jgi:broad specificity phosphatase PhoE